MARLTDTERLTKYEEALRNWECTGVIVYSPDADKWLRANLPKCTQLTLNKLLHDYVLRRGGEIDEVVEKRERWKDEWEFHHDLRPTFNGKQLYVETRLCYDRFDLKTEPTILVVNVHWA